MWREGKEEEEAVGCKVENKNPTIECGDKQTENIEMKEPFFLKKSVFSLTMFNRVEFRAKNPGWSCRNWMPRSAFCRTGRRGCF